MLYNGHTESHFSNLDGLFDQVNEKTLISVAAILPVVIDVINLYTYCNTQAHGTKITLK